MRAGFPLTLLPLFFYKSVALIAAIEFGCEIPGTDTFTHSYIERSCVGIYIFTIISCFSPKLRTVINSRVDAAAYSIYRP